VNKDAAPPLTWAYALACGNGGAVRRGWVRFAAVQRSSVRGGAPRLLPADAQQREHGLLRQYFPKGTNLHSHDTIRLASASGASLARQRLGSGTTVATDIGTAGPLPT
jgi:hypothetical protein